MKRIMYFSEPTLTLSQAFERYSDSKIAKQG